MTRHRFRGSPWRHLTKFIMAERFSESVGGGLQAEVLLFFKNFFMQVCGLISAWRTKLSVLWFLYIYICLLNASLTERVFIWLLLWFLLSKPGLICTFSLGLLFFCPYKGHLVYYLSFETELWFCCHCLFHVRSVRRHKMPSAALSSGFHVSIYLVLFTSVPSFERAHSLIIMPGPC